VVAELPGEFMMRKIIFRFLQILMGMYILYSCSNIFNSNYLKEGPSFFFIAAFKNEQNNNSGYDTPYSGRMVYLKKDALKYYFFVPALSDTFSLQLFGVEEVLPLKSDSSYFLIYEIIGGWPSTYGLIIKEGNELLFEGISDWELDERTTLYDSSGIDVTLHKVLGNRTHVTTTCRKKYTNLELKFAYGNDAVFLRQGKAATLRKWNIYLRIAREVEYMSDCLDDGVNGISFTILRR
jgi:hypothetical protein